MRIEGKLVVECSKDLDLSGAYLKLTHTGRGAGGGWTTGSVEDRKTRSEDRQDAV